MLKPVVRAPLPMTLFVGTYAAIGARIWLPATSIGMVVDTGSDFEPSLRRSLAAFGEQIWLYRENSVRKTTRARNTYLGERRGCGLKKFAILSVDLKPVLNISQTASAFPL